MCGRYTLKCKYERLKKFFEVINNIAELKLRYNIAPSQQAPVVLMEDGARWMRMMRWGLVPHWAKDTDFAVNLINAKAETVHEKASFRDAFEKRRCLVPATGFYEWYQPEWTNKNIPVYFYPKDELFAFAGIWDENHPPGKHPLLTYSIITTEPNDLVRPYHNRMPVILPREAFGLWLSGRMGDMEKLQSLLHAYPSDEMAMTHVSLQVNSPKHDTPDCIKPVDVYDIKAQMKYGQKEMDF
ncbi:SOS response-associated peptidase [Planctomycetota bacterium]